MVSGNEAELNEMRGPYQGRESHIEAQVTWVLEQGEIASVIVAPARSTSGATFCENKKHPCRCLRFSKQNDEREGEDAFTKRMALVVPR